MLRSLFFIPGYSGRTEPASAAAQRRPVGNQLRRHADGNLRRSPCSNLQTDGQMDRIDTVHLPIGLEIGARTPAEIAISVAAELIAHRAALRGGGSGLCPA